MEISELYKLRNIRATRQILSERIEALDRYGEANAGQKAALTGALANLDWQEKDEEKRLRAFIGSVEDAELRQIMDLRFLRGMPWVEISVEVTPLEKDASRNAPLMKLRRFLKTV